MAHSIYRSLPHAAVVFAGGHNAGDGFLRSFENKKTKNKAPVKNQKQKIRSGRSGRQTGSGGRMPAEARDSGHDVSDRRPGSPD